MGNIRGQLTARLTNQGNKLVPPLEDSSKRSLANRIDVRSEETVNDGMIDELIWVERWIGRPVRVVSLPARARRPADTPDH